MKSKSHLRIGLISPYSGGNLGDAAIIESAHVHLKRLVPNAEFVLIVLDCARVTKLHNLESFPLTGLKRSFYFSSGHPPPDDALTHHAPGSAWNSSSLTLKLTLKKIIGKVPLASTLARCARDTSQSLVLEFLHLQKLKRMMNSLDGLIVAGGGQFDDEFGGPWGHPYSMFKWVRQASKRRIPVFFAGVGVCEVSHPLTGWFLRHTIDKSDRVSLRDSGSIKILQRLGIRKEFESCPDLAFGLCSWNNRGRVHIHKQSPLRIGLSPIAYGVPGRWPTENVASFDRYWREFRALGTGLLREGYHITLFATDDADIGLTRELHKFLANMAPSQNRLRLLPTLSLPELLSSLQTFDAVIAGRLHGILLSHTSGIPALGISYHRKVRAHMLDMQQDRFDLDFAGFTADEALRLLNDLIYQRDTIVSSLLRICSDKCRLVEEEFAVIGKGLIPYVNKFSFSALDGPRTTL